MREKGEACDSCFTYGFCDCDDPVPMSKAFDELCNIVESAGLKLTFDRGRNSALACTFCGSLEGPHELVALGTYYQGDVLSRPVCVACMPIANLRAKKPEPAGVIPDDGKDRTT